MRPSENPSENSSESHPQTPPVRGTRERLLDAAEELYAECGIDATSLRAITRRAGANLAAVHYHFGSKERLTEAVLARRLVPLNRERLELLDAAESQAGPGAPPCLEAVLRALIGPVLRRTVDPGSERFVRLMGRMYSEPRGSIQELIPHHFAEVVARFEAALARVLPGLSLEEMGWRFHFIVGSLVHTVAAGAMWLRLRGGTPPAPEHLERLLVAFTAGGLRAPPAGSRHGECHEL